MSTVRRHLPLIPGVATTVFVMLCSLDGALGNMITVPATWLLTDAAVGVLALILIRCEYFGAAVMLAAVSTAAVGSSLMALTSIARTSRNRRVIGFALGLLMAEIFRWQLPWMPDATYQHRWFGAALAVLTITSVVAWGRYTGAHLALVDSLRQQNSALVRSRDAEVEAAYARERANLSREMHDVLAHRLSLITMYSSALEHRKDMSREERAASGRIVSANARACLSELRAILSDLREQTPSQPQPDISHLPSLVSESQTPQFPITLEFDLSESELPGGTGRHLFRIAQEGITNARKHGAPGPIDVSITDEDDGIKLVIINCLRGDEVDDGSGSGMKGITERVHLCRGQLTRHQDEGRHVLVVRVPRRETA